MLESTISVERDWASFLGLFPDAGQSPHSTFLKAVRSLVEAEEQGYITEEEGSLLLQELVAAYFELMVEPSYFTSPLTRWAGYYGPLRSGWRGGASGRVAYFAR